MISIMCGIHHLQMDIIVEFTEGIRGQTWIALTRRGLELFVLSQPFLSSRTKIPHSWANFWRAVLLHRSVGDKDPPSLTFIWQNLPTYNLSARPANSPFLMLKALVLLIFFQTFHSQAKPNTGVVPLLL